MRVLAGWVGASLVLHVLILLAVPHELLRDAPRVEILHVEIDRQEPQRESSQVHVASPSARTESEPHRKEAKPRTERKPAPSSQPQPKRGDRQARVNPLPSTLQSIEPAPMSVPREQAVAPQNSPAAPASARAAPDVAEALARDSVITLPPAPAAQTQSSAAEPALAPRIADAKPLSAPVRYPRTAEQGRVTLRVLVDREGRVAKTALEKTSGFSNLDRHALEAVRRWRFAPAMKGDQPVEQWLVVNVDY